MQPLAIEQFNAWRADAEVIEQDKHGEKVLRLHDGSYLKLFRYKRLLSKNHLLSPARRFQRNASLLRQLGIPCPQVLGTFRLTTPRRSLVHYQPLAGDTLRALLLTDDARDQQAQALGRFIAGLHQLGVYFRSLHLGNIIRTPEGTLGLIDIADLHCQSRPLSGWQRQRNLKHLLRYRQDWQAWQGRQLAALASGYADATPDPGLGQALTKALKGHGLPSA